MGQSLSEWRMPLAVGVIGGLGLSCFAHVLHSDLDFFGWKRSLLTKDYIEQATLINGQQEIQKEESSEAYLERIDMIAVRCLMDDLGLKSWHHLKTDAEELLWNYQISRPETLACLFKLMERQGDLQNDYEDFAIKRRALLKECEGKFKKVDFNDRRQIDFLRRYVRLCIDRLTRIEEKQAKNLRKISFALGRGLEIGWLKRMLDQSIVSRVEEDKVQQATLVRGINRQMARDLDTQWDAHKSQFIEAETVQQVLESGATETGINFNSSRELLSPSEKQKKKERISEFYATDTVLGMKHHMTAYSLKRTLRRW